MLCGGCVGCVHSVLTLIGVSAPTWANSNWDRRAGLLRLCAEPGGLRSSPGGPLGGGQVPGSPQGHAQPVCGPPQAHNDPLTWLHMLQSPGEATAGNFRSQGGANWQAANMWSPARFIARPLALPALQVTPMSSIRDRTAQLQLVGPSFRPVRSTSSQSAPSTCTTCTTLAA